MKCAEHTLHIPTLHQACKEFRSRVRRIVNLALAPEHHSCFQPYGISYVRLGCIGIASLLPGIQGQLCMTPDFRDHVFKVLVGGVHNLSGGKLSAALRGASRICPVRFPAKLRLDIFHGGRCKEAQRGISIVEPLSKVCVPHVFLLRCPHCMATRNAVGRKLYAPSGWISLVCARCGRGSAARKWKCTCGKAWVTCSIHQPQGYACIGTVRRVTARCHQQPSRTKRKRRSRAPRARRPVARLRNADTITSARQFIEPERDSMKYKRIKVSTCDALKQAAMTSVSGDSACFLTEPCVASPVEQRSLEVRHAAATKRKQADAVVEHARVRAARLSPPTPSLSHAPTATAGAIRRLLLP